MLAPQGPALKPTARLLRRPQAPAQPDQGPQRAQAIHLGLAAELWAQAIHLESQRNFGLRPVTSDSQGNFGLRPFTSYSHGSSGSGHFWAQPFTSNSQRNFTFWAQATLSSGYSPFWAQAIHLGCAAGVHLLGSGQSRRIRSRTSGSGHSFEAIHLFGAQATFGLRPPARTTSTAATAAWCHQSLGSSVVPPRPQTSA